MNRTLPSRWREVSDPDHIVEKYRPRDPTLFVREGRDVGVHVLPVSTSSPHDADRYRVGVVRGDRDEFRDEVPVETFDDRETALRVAHEFAEAFERADTGEDETDAAVESAVEALP